MPETRDPTASACSCIRLYRGRRDLAELIATERRGSTSSKPPRLDVSIASSELAHGSADQFHRFASKDGFTALHFACFSASPKSARLLLTAGAAANAVAANPMKVMPLHSAASARNVEAARLLLEHGAPPNARQQGGWAPIHAAAQNGDRAMVELLLHHGADPKLGQR